MPKDLNPPPKLKYPNHVTPIMVSRAFLDAGVHVRKRANRTRELIWDTCHDITNNLNRAVSWAMAAEMFFILQGPHYRFDNSNAHWEVSIPPHKGRCYRRFMAATPAKALCAALLDFLDHPAL